MNKSKSAIPVVLLVLVLLLVNSPLSKVANSVSSSGATVNLIGNCPLIRFPEKGGQGGRSTCTSFATVAFMEYEFINYPILEEKKDRNTFDLSEEFFAWAVREFKKEYGIKPAGQEEGGIWIEISPLKKLDEGINLFTAWFIAMHKGTCEEEEWPYKQKQRVRIQVLPPPVEYDVPPEGAKEQAEQYRDPYVLHKRATKSYEVYDTEKKETKRYGGGISDVWFNQIKKQLDEGHIVAFGVPIFYKEIKYPNGEVRKVHGYDRSTGEFKMPEKDPTEGAYLSDGAHAMDLVGYANDPSEEGKGYFILRNSWGDRFGKECPYRGNNRPGGYGTIPYEYVQSFCIDFLMSNYQPQYTQDFDPEFEETAILPPGEYPVCGDWWVDKQMEEEEEQEKNLPQL